MHHHTDIHLETGDQIVCRHVATKELPAGYPVISLGLRWPYSEITIHATVDRLRRLHQVIGGYLAAYDEDSHAPVDRTDIVPAEAVAGTVVDEGDLFEALAVTKVKGGES